MRRDYTWLEEFTNEELNRMYMHILTGQVDTMGGWVYAYTSNELEERGLSVAQAFGEDLYNNLYLVILGCSGEWIFKNC